MVYSQLLFYNFAKINPKSRTMPFTPEELYKFQQLSTAGKDAEIAALRKELDCQKEENMRLRLNPKEKPDENVIPQNTLVLDVDAVCKFMSELNDFQLAAFHLVAILRTTAESVPTESLTRMLNAMGMKKNEGVVNILSKGDWNIEKLTNLANMISAKRIEIQNAV